MSRQNMTPHQPTEVPVRRTEIKTWLTEETMSPLGRDLMKIAREIEASDDTALDENEIEQELKRRRGGDADDGE
jgi:hypothetical protein